MTEDCLTGKQARIILRMKYCRQKGFECEKDSEEQRAYFEAIEVYKHLLNCPLSHRQIKGVIECQCRFNGTPTIPYTSP